MDFSSILKLIPEFLGMLKNDGEGSGLNDIMQSAGNTGMLQNILSKGGQLTKYLPLLPLVSKFSKEGLKGLIGSSEDIALILDIISQSENRYAKMLRNIDSETVERFLPLISEFFEKKQSDKKEIIPMKAEEKTEKVQLLNSNPLSCISEIADKDILYALNAYISKDTD